MITAFSVSETQLDQPANDDLNVALHDALDHLIQLTKQIGGGAIHIQSETDDETREFRITLSDVTNATLCTPCAGTGIEGSHSE